MKNRGLRLTETENSLIEEFLAKNPALDFSTMARIAILQFIESPQIKLKPISTQNRPQQQGAECDR